MHVVANGRVRNGFKLLARSRVTEYQFTHAAPIQLAVCQQHLGTKGVCDGAQGWLPARELELLEEKLT